MKLPNSNFDLERRTSYRFAVLSAKNVRSTKDVYRRHGLTIYQWRTLSLIGHHEPIHPGQIAEITSIDPDQVTRAVDRLVAQGYVTRSVDAADRRRVQLALTSKGRDVYAEIESLHRSIERKLLNVLSREERDAFFHALAKLEVQAQHLFGGGGRNGAGLPANGGRAASAAKRDGARSRGAARPPLEQSRRNPRT